MSLSRFTLLLLALVGGFALAVPARAELFFYALSNNQRGGPSSILKVNHDGTSSAWAINWDSGLSLYDPYGLAMDAGGNLYVNDSENIFKITPGGVGTLFAQKPTNGNARGVAVDAAGNVYAVGSSTDFSHALYKYDAGGNLLAEWKYSALSGVVFGPDGMLYTSNVFQGYVNQIDPNTGVSTRYLDLDSVGSLAFGPDGALYVSEGSSISRFVNGVGTTVLNRRVNSATSLMVDRNGDLFVGNRRSNWDNEILKHTAGSASTSYSIFSDLTDRNTITGMVVIPEPSTGLIALFGGAALLAWRRARSLS